MGHLKQQWEDHGGMVPIRCNQIMALPSRVTWRLSISGFAALQNEQRQVTRNRTTYRANAALTLRHRVKIVNYHYCCAKIEQN
jgi:hypothetical protein